MKFSYNWLKELTGFRGSPQRLAELLTLHSFEVEVAGKVGGDWALEAKIPTNRISDAASHCGLAREIAAITSRTLRARARPTVRPAAPEVQGPPVTVTIASPRLCPRFSAQQMVVRSLKASPRWLRERLATCGFRSLNAIVDATNYVMLEVGQPLHAFDLDRVRGQMLIVREARRGETLTTLDGTGHVLPPGTLVIEDRERLIDLAGIMGGENSAVSGTTQRILLQAAVFDPVRIYRTVRALNFSSAAAKIYAAGIDTERTVSALERACELLEAMAGAERRGGRIDIYPRKSRRTSIRMSTHRANRIIGEEISPAFYRTLWRRLGFGAAARNGGWLVTVPPERRDIGIEEDLIEEVARLWGYGKLRARHPESHLTPTTPSEELFWKARVTDVLVGAGLAEVHAHRFTGKSLLETFGAATDDLLELENPMGPATQYLGAHPAQQYLRIAAENLRRDARVAIFGVAKGFRRLVKSSPQAPIDERTYLVMVEAAKTGDAEVFYRMKGALDQLLESLGIADHWYDDALTPGERQKAGALHPYRRAKVMADGEFLGMIGELHPAVAERLKARGRIVFAELDFEKLWKVARSEAEYRPVGKYPAVIRDIAVVVPERTKTEDVLNVIENTGPLLADTDLFDYFQDAAMAEAGQKSLAFHLIFQSPERTLTDEEVNRLYKKIVAVLQSEDWEVRE